MTLTTSETLTVNGVALNTLAYNIESLTGRLRVPKLRTENIEVPGRHGAIRANSKKYEQAEIILPMWVRGCDPDGKVPSGNNRTEFFKNLDTLTKLFCSPWGGLLDVRHTLPDGSVRQCFAEVLESFDFSTQGANPLGKFSVALTIPDVFWRDINQVVGPAKPVPSSGTVVTFTEFAGATAPTDDAWIILAGPMANFKVEAYLNGSALPVSIWFQYTGSIAAGQTLIVNCSAWTLSGGGGFTPNYSLFSHSGSSRWMSLIPGSTGAQLRFTGTGFTGSTSVTIWGYRKFLVG